MKAFCLLTVSAAALLSATAAQAATDPVKDSANDTPTTAAPQDTQATDAKDNGEIVVTAERRSISLQRAPVAATVLTGEDLTRKSVNGVEQLQFASPSLTVNTTGQGNAFNIRGIGKTEQTSAIGVGVITYRDGVATLPGYFQSEPYYDIASVEVLRGPQGTFAGGNATGGAVFITEVNPSTDRVKGYALAQYGNYNDVKLQGAVNLPISDTLALRVAGNMERRDSFYTVTGPWTGNPGDLRGYSGRASLLWQPSDNFRVLIKGDYNNIEYGGIPASSSNIGTATAPIPNTSDPLIVANNTYMNGRDEFGRVVVNISYVTDGGVTFRSISGYQKGTTQVNFDGDGNANVGTTAAPQNYFRDHISEEIWSQEFNIVSPDTGRFTWLIGGYYQDDKIFIPANGGYYSDQTPNAIPTVLDIEIVGTNPKKALAAFGQVGYEVTPGLQIQVGARWSRTSSANDAVARAYVTGIPNALLSLPQKDKATDEKVNGKVAINWTLNANNFVYAFAATGSKQGGLNGPNVFGITPKAFEAEDVTDFELGWKGTFADGHLRTQIGGYYSIYKNYQVNIVDPTSPNITSLYNVAGDTELYGLEMSAQGNFDALSFDLSASISNSSLGKFYAADPRLGAAPAACNVSTGPATARCINLEGREQTYAPKFTFSAGIQYAITLGEGTTLTPRVDYAHIASTWGTLFQDAQRGDKLPERNIVNAQLTLNSGDWTLAAYSTNLTDQHYVGAINGARRLAGAPQQYGVRASIRF